MSKNDAPFLIGSEFGRFALAYGALWIVLLMIVESGHGDLASALAVLIASGATVVGLENVIGNLGFGGKANGRP